jgi:hypothetical protein
MAKAKTIPIHNSGTFKGDDIHIKTNRHHLQSPLQAITQKSNI